MILVGRVNAVLFNSSIIYFSLLTGITLTLLLRNAAFRRDLIQFFQQFKLIHFLIAIIGFLFAFFFYSPHLATIDGTIFRSGVYWDFTVIYPIVQAFIFGENFPPQNMTYSGIPLTYHYFCPLLTSIYSVLGLPLTSAINFFSITQLTLFVLALVGAGEVLFTSLWTGALIAFLAFTTGSLRFIADIFGNSLIGVWTKIRELFWNTGHPDDFAILDDRSYGYNGSMFNMFYYLEERQMVTGSCLLVLGVLLIYKRANLSRLEALFAGISFGLLYEWHLAATMVLFSTLFFVLLLSDQKAKSFYMLLSFSAVAFLFTLWFKMVMHDPAFLESSKNFPAFNPTFPTMSDANFNLSFKNFILYWGFAYGIRIILFFAGLFLLIKHNKQLAILLACAVIPTFVLLNTVQFFPLSIYENHKFLKLLNLPMEMLCAFAIYHIWSLNAWRRGMTIAVIAIASISGIIEIIPYLRDKPDVRAILYSNDTINNLRDKTSPNAVFLSERTSLVLMAGRRLFVSYAPELLGNQQLYDYYLDVEKREEIAKEIYSVNTLYSFCKLAQKHFIDYVETEGVTYNRLINFNDPYLVLIDFDPALLGYIDVKASCIARNNA